MPATYAGYTGTPGNANLDALWAKTGMSVTDAAFGADPTGVRDSTAAFRLIYATACSQAAALGGWVDVIIPYGRFLVPGGLLLITNDRVRTHCLGTLVFNPTGTQRLFKIQKVNPAQIVAYVQFFGLQIEGGGSQQKIAFDIYDSSQVLIEDLTVTSWTGNGGNAANPSTAVWTHGREFFKMNRWQVSADRPVWFDVNANSATLCTDHFHLSGGYMIVMQSNQVGIGSAAGVVHSNLTIDEDIAVAGGRGAIRFLDGAVFNSTVMSIANVRYEQPADVTGFAIEILNTTVGLSIRDSTLGGSNVASNGGLKLRKATAFSGINLTYQGSAGNVAVDADTTCDGLNFIGCPFAETSVMNMGGLSEMFALPKLGSLSPDGQTSFWKNPTIGTPASLRINDTQTDYMTVLLLGTGQVSPVFTMGVGGQELKVATLTVSGSSADGTIHEAGVATANKAGAKLISGTTNFKAANTASSLCVLWQNSANVVILNNTAKALNIVAQAVWVR